MLGCTTSKIGDLEAGRSAPKVAELDRLLDFYRVTGAERADLLESPVPPEPQAAQRVHGRGDSLHPTPGSRPGSTSIRGYLLSSALVPGVLQTEVYAEATLRWANTNSEAEVPAEVQRLLELRTGRKAALIRTDREPPRYWCILGEAALRTPTSAGKR